MGDPILAVTWESHQNNICHGLSLLQQRGEYVDMTLAADGHHVKVHQMVMSLVSPYIKELISTIQCPHPVVFLNKVSYETLKSILEYVYAGEVLLPKHKLTDFLQACKELHIKGLEGDNIEATEHNDLLHVFGARLGEDAERVKERKKEESARKKEEKEQNIIEAARKANNSTIIQIRGKKRKMESKVIEEEEVMEEQENLQEDFQMDEHALDDVEEPKIISVQSVTQEPDPEYNDNQEYPSSGSLLQYTLSNQGNIQLILNRYLYRMRHTRKNNERMWRCVNYDPNGCNATCVTKDDMVIFRGRAHNHPFHDKQILKRLHSNNIYTAFHAVQNLSSIKARRAGANASVHVHSSTG